MTATDELRRLLDGRGVEYYESPKGISWGKMATPMNGRMYAHYAVELDDLLCVSSYCITPKQAIEATLDNDLKAENAKLRELVRDANKAAHMLCEAWEGSCSKETEGMSLHAGCPISDTNELCVFGKLDDRMRELGVD